MAVCGSEKMHDWTIEISASTHMYVVVISTERNVRFVVQYHISPIRPVLSSLPKIDINPDDTAHIEGLVSTDLMDAET